MVFVIEDWGPTAINDQAERGFDRKRQSASKPRATRRTALLPTGTQPPLRTGKVPLRATALPAVATAATAGPGRPTARTQTRAGASRTTQSTQSPTTASGTRARSRPTTISGPRAMAATTRAMQTRTVALQPTNNGLTEMNGPNQVVITKLHLTITMLTTGAKLALTGMPGDAIRLPRDVSYDKCAPRPTRPSLTTS